MAFSAFTAQEGQGHLRVNRSEMRVLLVRVAQGLQPALPGVGKIDQRCEHLHLTPRVDDDPVRLLQVRGTG